MGATQAPERTSADLRVYHPPPMTDLARDWTALEHTIEGQVVRPGSPAYDTARRPAIARFRDARPAAVVRCATAGDVAAALAFAREAGLAVATRSGGHCFAGHSSTDGIVIDVGPMDAVTVTDQTATIGAGARLGAVYDALDAHGLAIPAGCGPRVGVAGLTLGGGLGILGRNHGLLCDALTGARVVLADGRVVDCDAEREPDLFWALRGAGAAGFGVVTELRFATVPTPDATRFQVAWPPGAAAAVAEAWQRWSPDAPDPLAASLLVTAPPDPDAPLTVTVAGAYIGPEAEAARLLDDLAARAGAAPEATTLVHAAFRKTKRALAPAEGELDPLERDHVESRSEFFAAPIPAAAIAALVAHLDEDRRAGEARELDFGPFGGAYSRIPPDATAFVHRDARFLLKHAVALDVDADAPAREAGRVWLEGSFAIVHPHGTGGVYPNFPEDGLEDWPRAYYGANLDRLVAIRERYDPGDVLRAAQSIPRRASVGRPG
jgi:FAD/FMN-containing dehydrogenase